MQNTPNSSSLPSISISRVSRGSQNHRSQKSLHFLCSCRSPLTCTRRQPGLLLAWLSKRDDTFLRWEIIAICMGFLPL